jgi:RNA polymerase sigma-70 factor (ECF subfamily)
MLPMNTSEPDIEALVAGDGAAWSSLVSSHQRCLLHRAFNVLHRRQEAEEVVNDSFVRLHRLLRSGKFRGECSLRTMLWLITTRLSYNRTKYLQSRREHLKDSLDYASESGVAWHERLADPSSQVHDLELQELVDNLGNALEALPESQREIIAMAENECSYEEIAQHCGTIPNTVKSRLSRARKNLRELVASSLA